MNLLDDHIVDLLLDSAAMGKNYVEREGVSFTHPSKFILVGTMNPEEGDLRPQLLDRFGMASDVKSEKDVESRVEVIRRRLDFDRDPGSFAKKYEAEQNEMKERILSAERLMESMSVEDDALKMTIEASLYFGPPINTAILPSAATFILQPLQAMLLVF